MTTYFKAKQRPRIIRATFGPMGGGKSARAQQQAMKQPELYLQEDPWELIYLKPEFDDRSDGFHTRVGDVHRPATILPGKPEGVIDLFRSFRGKKVVLVGDEVQFFGINKHRTDLTPEEIEAMGEAAIELGTSGVPMHLAGLGSFFSRVTPPMVAWFLLDPRVRKTFVRAICSSCGRRAQLTQRYTNGKPSRRGEPVYVVEPPKAVHASGAKTEEPIYAYAPSCNGCHVLPT